jgi:hypothetical protein
VIGDCLNIGEGACGGVVGVDDDLAGAGSVGRAVLVEGRRLILLDIGGHGFDDERSLGQASEELGKPGLHLVEIALIGGKERLF